MTIFRLKFANLAKYAEFFGKPKIEISKTAFYIESVSLIFNSLPDSSKNAPCSAVSRISIPAYPGSAGGPPEITGSTIKAIFRCKNYFSLLFSKNEIKIKYLFASSPESLMITTGNFRFRARADKCSACFTDKKSFYEFMLRHICGGQLWTSILIIKITIFFVSEFLKLNYIKKHIKEKKDIFLEIVL